MPRTVEHVLVQAVANLTLQNAQLIVQLEESQAKVATLTGELAEARALHHHDGIQREPRT